MKSLNKKDLENVKKQVRKQIQDSYNNKKDKPFWIAFTPKYSLDEILEIVNDIQFVDNTFVLATTKIKEDAEIDISDLIYREIRFAVLLLSQE